MSTELCEQVYLTKREAAEIARCTVRTIENWVGRGLLQACGGPGVMLIRRDVLIEFIERPRRPGR